MASLFGPTGTERHHRLPEKVRQHIVALRAEHRTLQVHEITTICWVRFGQRPSSHPPGGYPVKRILAETPPVPVTARRFPPYHHAAWRAPADPAAARLAIIRLHSEGWNRQSIADYLQINLDTVRLTLARWVAEGVAGLDDKSRPAPSGAEDRPAGDAERQGDAGDPRPRRVPGPCGAMPGRNLPQPAGCPLGRCGRVLAVIRKLYGLPKAERAPREPKAMPFAAERRHRYWSVDIRHLDLPQGAPAKIGMKVYCVSILENFSRAILASGVFPTQGLSARVPSGWHDDPLRGDPATWRARDARQRQRRGLRDGKTGRRSIRRSASRSGRSGGASRGSITSRRCSMCSAGWPIGISPRRPTGRNCSPFGRKLDRLGGRPLGSMRFRRWRIYGEHGLAKEHAAVWLYAETLTIEFADEVVAQYKVRYQPDKAHLLSVEAPRLFETPYRSAQLPLWALSDAEWLKVLRRPPYAPRKLRRELPMQAALPA